MKRLTFAVLSVVALCLTACSSFESVYNINYQPQPFDLGGVPRGKSLYVAPITDDRISSEKVPFDQNDPLILIPLWPYTYAEVNPLLTYSYFQNGLYESLSTLLPRDLVASGLFEEVHSAKIVDNPPLPPPQDAYQLVVRLKKAAWRRYLTSYGLSSLGAYLWFFMPKSYGSTVLSVNAQVREPGTGKVLAEDTFTFEESTTEWIYDQMNYQPPVSVFALEKSFPELMGSIRGMLFEVIRDSAKAK